MSSYVLVPGGWCGGFLWREVAERLRSAGHVVYAPSLTGLADRSHLLRADVDLATHVSDIVNLIKWEQLSDVVLVGHSYGGMVISGVAELVPEGVIKSIVYLDAFYAPSGKSVADCAPQLAASFTVDPVPFLFFGQTGDDELEHLVTPQSLRTFTDRPTLSGARDRIPVKTYILATKPPMPWFASMAAELATRPDWRYREMACGHGMMRDRPDETTALLIEAGEP